MRNSKYNNEVLVFSLSLLCLIYFALLFLNSYVLNYNSTLIGVFQELLTIPFLLGTLGLWVISGRSVYLEKFAIKNISCWSFIILTILSTLVFGSFFFNY